MENDIQKSWKQHGGSPIKCIIDVSKNSKHLLHKKLEIEGLTGVHGRILNYIFLQQRAGKNVHQKDIEEVSRLSKSSVTSILQALEKKGYIKRECENDDARLKRLMLTDDGMEIQNEVASKIKELESQVMSALTEEEYNNFLAYMKKIDDKILELRIDQEV